MTNNSPLSNDELQKQLDLLTKGLVDIGIDKDENLLKIYLNELFDL